MSNPRARRAVTWPTRPIPTMPSRLPVTWVPTMKLGLQSRHSRVRTKRSPSLARRAAPSISMMVSSAVASESTSGVLVTTMPLAFAASRSTWSNPTEKLAMMRMLSGSRAITGAEKRSVWQGRTASAPAARSIISSLE